jgi:nucleotide-binding universal stress UspA family protein
MKSILVPTENDSTIKSALETALLLAKRCDSYIEGFSLQHAISEYIVADAAGGIPLESYEQDNLQEAAQARQLFDTFMRERNVPRVIEPSVGLSYGWLDDAPEGDGFVGSYGRVFDVTVFGRSNRNTVGLHQRAIESALFESGRPLLIAPPSVPNQIATNIMIHWNGSTEQARTIAFAMPLLHQAVQVSVLTVVEGQGVPGPTAEQLIKQLQRSGILAKSITVELEGRSTGEAVLAAVSTEGCDLLVKGAFTRSRLREMIFGGATSHILANADVPVLMAH